MKYLPHPRERMKISETDREGIVKAEEARRRKRVFSVFSILLFIIAVYVTIVSDRQAKKAQEEEQAMIGIRN